jgi:hypothetical protein
MTFPVGRRARAPKADVAVGDSVRFRGEYEWSERSGVASPAPRNEIEEGMFDVGL